MDNNYEQSLNQENQIPTNQRANAVEELSGYYQRQSNGFAGEDETKPSLEGFTPEEQVDIEQEAQSLVE